MLQRNRYASSSPAVCHRISMTYAVKKDFFGKNALKN
jgi:hypothetical protein